jgi:hypothetical protein
MALRQYLSILVLEFTGIHVNDFEAFLKHLSLVMWSVRMKWRNGTERTVVTIVITFSDFLHET